MATRRRMLTYEDYAALPSDGRRHEILEGALAVTPAPSPDHQDVLANLNELVRRHVRNRALGRTFFAPVDVILSDTTVVQPDLVYVDPERAPRVSGRGIEGPPTLVVEVLSPGTAAIDRGDKLQLYARHGVPYYWIVDAAGRAIEAYELAGGAYRLVIRAAGDAPVSLPPFPDLALAPDSLWP